MELAVLAPNCFSTIFKVLPLTYHVTPSRCFYVYRIFPKKVELQALMTFYDVDGDGNISYEEFIRGLRDELTPRRKAMVDKAFAMMDRDGSGQITLSS